MKRFNNAPPPESEWRLEVLKAKREAEEAGKQASKQGRSSRSASRSRERGRRRQSSRSRSPASRKAPQPRVPAVSNPAPKPAKGEQHVAPASRLAQIATQRGDVAQGWYAAVARAAEAWEAVDAKKKTPVPGLESKLKSVQPGPATVQQGGSKAASSDRASEVAGLLPALGSVEERRGEDDEAQPRRVKERLSPKEEAKRIAEERKRQQQEEARRKEELEAMEQRNADRRKKAEEERVAREKHEKTRKQKLKGAFAMEDGDDDESEREKAFSKLAVERGGVVNPVAARAASQVRGVSMARGVSLARQHEPDMSEALAVPGASRRLGAPDEDLGQKLGFEKVMDPADAFIKLQERKRKGRRAEFGGPPRNCSPWRDGKKGVVTPLAQYRDGARSRSRSRRR